MKKHWFRYALKAALFISVGLLFFGWGLMSLWNALVPPVFAGPAITFWQALGLFALTRLLLGGMRAAWPRRYSRWRHLRRKQMASMNPDEREKLRQAYARRCRHWPRQEAASEPAREQSPAS